MSDPRSEALKDRMITVRIPYNLKVSEEVRIYRKLLNHDRLREIHIAPHTLEVVAMFAVMTRLEESEHAGLTRIKKMKLYNGEDVEGFTQKDVKEDQSRSHAGRDGRHLARVYHQPHLVVADPAGSQMHQRHRRPAGRERGDRGPPVAERKAKEEYIGLIADARKEYDEIARIDVQKAFFVSFEEEVATLLSNYLDHVEAYLDDTTLIDPVTGEESEPDERLMRSIEEKVNVSEAPRTPSATRSSAKWPSPSAGTKPSTTPPTRSCAKPSSASSSRSGGIPSS